MDGPKKLTAAAIAATLASLTWDLEAPIKNNKRVRPFDTKLQPECFESNFPSTLTGAHHI